MLGGQPPDPLDQALEPFLRPRQERHDLLLLTDVREKKQEKIRSVRFVLVRHGRTVPNVPVPLVRLPSTIRHAAFPLSNRSV
jgi:hypothetical protein